MSCPHVVDSVAAGRPSAALAEHIGRCSDCRAARATHQALKPSTSDRLERLSQALKAEVATAPKPRSWGKDAVLLALLNAGLALALSFNAMVSPRNITNPAMLASLGTLLMSVLV
jgi:hypothetical protein